MKVVSIYKHLKSVKWYTELFDKITVDGAKRWEERVHEMAYSPKPMAPEEMKELLIEKHPNITDQEVWDSSNALMTLASFAVSHAYTKIRNKDKRKTIKEWRGKDREKDNRILNTQPLEGIKCPICESVMEYKFSELHDRGTLEKPDEMVMFFYECPKKCKRKFVFEDGTPWISKEKNLCPICQGERNTTITKDNQGNLFFIYECVKCKSRQVEKDTD